MSHYNRQPSREVTATWIAISRLYLRAFFFKEKPSGRKKDAQHYETILLSQITRYKIWASLEATLWRTQLDLWADPFHSLPPGEVTERIPGLRERRATLWMKRRAFSLFTFFMNVSHWGCQETEKCLRWTLFPPPPAGCFPGRTNKAAIPNPVKRPDFLGLELSPHRPCQHGCSFSSPRPPKKVTLRWGKAGLWRCIFPLSPQPKREGRWEKALEQMRREGGGRRRNVAASAFAPKATLRPFLGAEAFLSFAPPRPPPPLQLFLHLKMPDLRKGREGGKKNNPPRHFWPRFPRRLACNGSRHEDRYWRTAPNGLSASSSGLNGFREEPAAKRPTDVRQPPPPLLLTVPGFQAAESPRHNKTSQSARTP